jgi:hypothetical protein
MEEVPCLQQKSKRPGGAGEIAVIARHRRDRKKQNP